MWAKKTELGWNGKNITLDLWTAKGPIEWKADLIVDIVSTVSCGMLLHRSIRQKSIHLYQLY